MPRMTRPALVVLVLFRLASSQDVKVLWHLPQDVCGWERLPLDERYCERDGKQVYGRDNCKNYNLDYMPYPSRNKAEKACFDHGCQGLAKKGWLTRAYYPADPRRKSPNGRWVPWGFGWTATSSTTGYFYHDKDKDGIWVLEERPGTRTNGAYCYGCPPIHDCERRPVTCRSVGDPHFRGFDGQTWDFNGVGAYLLASVTKSFELQAYQCPGIGIRTGASANTALYMRTRGGSTLFLDGRDGSVNVTDASSGESTVVQQTSSELSLRHGTFLIAREPTSQGRFRWRITLDDGTILFVTRNRAPVRTGFVVHAWVTVSHSMTTSDRLTGLCAGPCAASEPTADPCANNACLELRQEALFPAEALAALDATCGVDRAVGVDDSTNCDPPATPEELCANSSMLAASQAHCSHLDDGSDTTWYHDCMFDFCAFDGDGCVSCTYGEIIEEEESIIVPSPPPLAPPPPPPPPQFPLPSGYDIDYCGVSRTERACLNQNGVVKTNLGKQYKTDDLSEALEKCSTLDNCMAVYDGECNGRSFRICSEVTQDGLSTALYPNRPPCVYKKHPTPALPPLDPPLPPAPPGWAFSYGGYKNGERTCMQADGNSASRNQEYETDNLDAALALCTKYKYCFAVHDFGCDGKKFRICSKITVDVNTQHVVGKPVCVYKKECHYDDPPSLPPPVLPPPSDPPPVLPPPLLPPPPPPSSPPVMYQLADQQQCVVDAQGATQCIGITPDRSLNDPAVIRWLKRQGIVL